MKISKIYKVKTHPYENGSNSFYEIPVIIERGCWEKTVGLEKGFPKFKKYLKNMHSDWRDALVLPIRQADKKLRPPYKGEVLRVSGHGGVTDIGIIEEVIESLEDL